MLETILVVLEAIASIALIVVVLMRHALGGIESILGRREVTDNLRNLRKNG